MTTDSYWDQFYSKPHAGGTQAPSDFADFIYQNFPGMTQLVEFGCGSGQDARMLGSKSKKLWGIDQSAVAISFCKKMDHVGEYIVGDLTVLEHVLSEAAASNEKTLLYSRFVLHALNREDQDQFIHLVGHNQIEHLTVALEYRVLGDAELFKLYPDHERHYVDHIQLVKQIEALGFAVTVSLQAQGLSRFKNEDPLLGRLVASRIL